jgi:ParB/RepB/Spo0J family partition protein
MNAKLQPTPVASAAAPEVLEIPLGAIEPHPANQRRFAGDDAAHPGLQELAASIRAVGLLEPIIVRHWRESVHKGAENHYQLLAGERRWRAMRLVPGATTIAAIVRDVGDREALEILVTENLQRKDLSPLEEAAGVKALVDQAGWTIQDVADRLGRPLHWVALRARLANLSPKWQAAAANPKSAISEWPAGHLELIARLEPDAQDALFGNNGHWLDREIPRRSHLEREIGELTRELRKATWKLADEALYPEAGACTACPKRSSCHPGLFDDQAVDAPAKHDRCLDPVCWGEKVGRQLKATEAELREKHGKIMLLHGAWDPKERMDRSRKDVVDEYQVATAKKGDPQAVPALVVDGRGRGAVRWVKPRSSEGGRSSARPRDEKGKPEPTPLKERRAQLDRRRRVYAVQRIQGLVEACSEPVDELLIQLAAIFGTWHRRDSSQFDHGEYNPERGDYGRAPQWAWKALRELDRNSVNGASSRALLWQWVRKVLVARLQYGGSQTDVKKLWADAHGVSEVLGLDDGEALQEAVVAIPEPKSWAHLNADGTPKTVKAKKGEPEKALAKKVRKAKPAPAGGEVAA